MEFSRKSHGNFLIYVSSELSPFSISSFSLPGDNFVDDGLLFAGGAAQIDAGGFYAFVAHQVSEQRNVVKSVEEILGVSVTERVWINHLGVESKLHGILLQLLRDAARGYPFTEAVEKQVAGVVIVGIEPNDGFFS